MNYAQNTYILNYASYIDDLEQTLEPYLLPAPEGYYRKFDIKPVLPVTNSRGQPCTYYVKTNSLVGERYDDVFDLTKVKGVIYNESNQKVLRISRLGEITNGPQFSVIGMSILIDFIRAYIFASRSWTPFVLSGKSIAAVFQATKREKTAYLKSEFEHLEDSSDYNEVPDYTKLQSFAKNFHNPNLYSMFAKYVKSEYLSPKTEEDFSEPSIYQAEVTLSYLMGKSPMRYTDNDAFVKIMKTIIDAYRPVISPIEKVLLNNPWAEYEVRFDGAMLTVIDTGDYRIKEWEFHQKSDKIFKKES